MDRRQFLIFSALGGLALALPLARDAAAIPNTPSLSIVLDDAGADSHDLANLEQLVEMKFPATIAVIPRTTHEEAVLKTLSKAPYLDIFAHIPMEFEKMRNSDPKKDHSSWLEQTPRKVGEKYNPVQHAAIYAFDTPAIAVKILADDITHLNNILTQYGKKSIVGFNNHTGSLVTQDTEKMFALATYAKTHGLIIVDSKTTLPERPSVLFREAKRVGATAYERTVFLDLDVDPVKQLQTCYSILEKGKSVIAIGHIKEPATITALAQAQKTHGQYIRKISEI